MPASSIPGVVFVVAMFGAFMAGLGWVSISLSLADRRDAARAKQLSATPRTAGQAVEPTTLLSRAA